MKIELLDIHIHKIESMLGELTEMMEELYLIGPEGELLELIPDITVTCNTLIKTKKLYEDWLKVLLLYGEKEVV